MCSPELHGTLTGARFNNDEAYSPANAACNVHAQLYTSIRLFLRVLRHSHTHV